jgi:peroxiredoxin
MNPAAADAIRAARSQHEQTLEQLSHGVRALVVFLRHSGCPFCRQALCDLAANRATLEASTAGEPVRLVLVHMMSEAQAAPFIARYGLSDVPRISDPDRSLYAALDLQRMKVLQLFSTKGWWRGFMAGIVKGHGAARPQPGEDWKQMPGVFLLKDGQPVFSFRHQTASDRPDYLSLAGCFDAAAAAALQRERHQGSGKTTDRLQHG